MTLYNHTYASLQPNVRHLTTECTTLVPQVCFLALVNHAKKMERRNTGDPDRAYEMDMCGEGSYTVGARAHSIAV